MVKEKIIIIIICDQISLADSSYCLKKRKYVQILMSISIWGGIFFFYIFPLDIALSKITDPMSEKELLKVVKTAVAAKQVLQISIFSI